MIFLAASEHQPIQACSDSSHALVCSLLLWEGEMFLHKALRLLTECPSVPLVIPD
jgi:hypothetical protein